MQEQHSLQKQSKQSNADNSFETVFSSVFDFSKTPEYSAVAA